MAQKRRNKGTAVGAGIIVVILAALGIGEFGIGGFGGGMVTDVFAPDREETVVYEENTSDEYHAEIMIVEDIVTLNGEEVEAADLPTLLSDVNGKEIIVIDGGATHEKWTEVVDTVSKLDCVVQTK